MVLLSSKNQTCTCKQECLTYTFYAKDLNTTYVFGTCNAFSIYHPTFWYLVHTHWMSTSHVPNGSRSRPLGELGFNQSGGPLLFNHPKGIATDGTVLMMRMEITTECYFGMKYPSPTRNLLWCLDSKTLTPTTPSRKLNSTTSRCRRQGGKYIIADTYNHRTLIWNELPSTNASNQI